MATLENELAELTTSSLAQLRERWQRLADLDVTPAESGWVRKSLPLIASGSGSMNARSPLIARMVPYPWDPRPVQKNTRWPTVKGLCGVVHAAAPNRAGWPNPVTVTSQPAQARRFSSLLLPAAQVTKCMEAFMTFARLLRGARRFGRPPGLNWRMPIRGRPRRSWRRPRRTARAGHALLQVRTG
jgi:hypothetical protein